MIIKTWNYKKKTLIEIYNGIYRIIIEIIETSAIPTRIWVTLIVAAVSIFLIAVVREKINEKYEKKLPMPVPIDIIVVSTVCCLIHTFLFKSLI